MVSPAICLSVTCGLPSDPTRLQRPASPPGAACTDFEFISDAGSSCKLLLTLAESQGLGGCAAPLSALLEEKHWPQGTPSEIALRDACPHTCDFCEGKKHTRDFCLCLPSGRALHATYLSPCSSHSIGPAQRRLESKYKALRGRPGLKAYRVVSFLFVSWLPSMSLPCSCLPAAALS